MKTEDEIRRCHDTLMAIARNEVAVGQTKEVSSMMGALASALCWVLDCPETKHVLQELIEIAEKWIESAGYKMVDMGEPVSKEEFERRMKP